jgi:hypothetical protein
MRQSVTIFVIAALLVAALPADVGAQSWQWQPLQGKLLVNVNVGIQVGDNDLSRQSTFELYDENAEVDVNQTINGGFFFELGAATRVQRVHKDFGVGFAWSILSNSGDGTISGTLPHPLFFDQPRSFEATERDLKHTENGFHFQAVWFMPFTDKVDFTFYGGPSLFRVTQGLLRSVQFSEVPPNFTTVTIDSVDVLELSDSGWGFNLGGDVTYALTPSIGVAGLLRYTHGNVEFNLSDTQTADVKAGGFQLGAGLRMRF